MAQALTSLIYLIATNFTNLQIIPQTRLEIWHSNGNPSRICSTASQWLLTHSLGPKEEPTMAISPKTVNTHHLEAMQSQTPITVSYTSSQLASTCSQFQLSSAPHATNSCYHSLAPQVCYNMTLKSCSPWSSQTLSQFPNPTVSQAMNHFPICPLIPSTKAEGEGYDRGWDGWMASLIQWTWVWASSGSWWWTGKPDVSMGSQKAGHDWVAELKVLLRYMFTVLKWASP